MAAPACRTYVYSLPDLVCALWPLHHASSTHCLPSLQVGGRSVVNPDIAQFVEIRPEADRFLRLLEILGEWYEAGKIIIFVHTQDKADSLFRDLLKVCGCLLVCVGWVCCWQQWWRVCVRGWGGEGGSWSRLVRQGVFCRMWWAENVWERSKLSQSKLRRAVAVCCRLLQCPPCHLPHILVFCRHPCSLTMMPHQPSLLPTPCPHTIPHLPLAVWLPMPEPARRQGAERP
jgi:hypothetical protein